MKKILLAFLYGGLMRNFLKIFIGVSYSNRRVLTDTKQFILVANHNSHVDTMAIMAAVPAAKVSKVHPVAASDYFGSSGFRAYCTRLLVNAILIPRSRPKYGSSAPDPIQLMVAALDRGESIIIFPEGSRGDPEVMQHFKRGVGLVLQQRPHIPYIPVHMKGMGKVLPKGEMLLVPFNTSVTFGEAQYCLGDTPEAIAADVEKQVLAMGKEFQAIRNTFEIPPVNEQE